MIQGSTAGWTLARALLARAQAPTPAPVARVTDSTTTARILHVTPEQYFADPCKTPSLSSGIAHAIVAESPLHAWTQHPRLGGSANGSVGTKAMNDGALIHLLLLGKGKDIILVDAPDFRTKEARAARDSAIAAGRIPVLQHQFAEKAAIAAKLRDRCAELGIKFDGESEVAIEWIDQCADGPVLCRSMLDHVWIDDGVILDIKTARSAKPSQIERMFQEYGYPLQQTAYVRALTALRPELEGRVRMIFVFAEIEPPFAVTPIEPDGAFREIGNSQWQQAVQLWQRCMASNSWPSYCEKGTVIISPPAWVLKEHLGDDWHQ